MTGHRTPGPRAVELDRTTGTLRMGGAEQRLQEATGSEAVFSAYLSLLYGVRGAQRGEELPLRAADLEALLEIVGEDPDHIERRLVELMGCTVEEASLLTRVLLRHRALAATAGVAAGLSLVALLGTASASSDTPRPAPAAVVTTPSEPPLEQPPLEAWLTTDDGAHVPVPQDWAAQEPPGEEPAGQPVEQLAPVEVSSPPPAPRRSAPAPAAATTAPAAARVEPSVAPSSPAPARAAQAPAPPPSSPKPSPDSSPEAAAEDEVVLGEPRPPIDRPGFDPDAPADEDGVVLGEPRPPIDRPGFDPDAPDPAPDQAPGQAPAG